jgi:hypothetical protein
VSRLHRAYLGWKYKRAESRRIRERLRHFGAQGYTGLALIQKVMGFEAVCKHDGQPGPFCSRCGSML